MSNIVTYQTEKDTAIITLDDGKANAVSHALLEELDDALNNAEKDKKLVVLAGRPGKFSAGFDLSIMKESQQAAMKLVKEGAILSQRLLQFPTPVTIACTGHSLAMGGLLLLSVDYRIGIEGPFKIGLNEVAIGMTMPYFGVELGRGRLNPAYLGRAVNNAEMFNPETAVEAGFLDSLVPADNLLENALAISEQLANLNLAAHHATKIRTRKPMLNAIAAGIEKEFG